jgi:hypothetical protein
MPKLKIVCSDKPKLKQGEIRNKNPGDCFKKGIRIGFVAGLQKCLKKQVKIKPILDELKNARPVLKKVVPSNNIPSLAILIENRINKATRKIRDFLTTLPINNKQYQLSTKKKKAMSTDGLKTYLIATGEYRR